MVNLPVNSVVDGTRTHRETSGQTHSQTRRRETCVSRSGTMWHDRRAWGHSDFHVGDVGSVGAILRPPDTACSLPCDTRGQGRRVTRAKRSAAPPTSTPSVGKRGDQRMQLGMSKTTIEVQP